MENRNYPIMKAVINNDDSIRAISSSGGVFYALAQQTVTDNGVVFGVRFDENWNAVHDYSETIDGIKFFVGSKYLQSIVGDAYILAEKFLREGRRVLFSGTPCQIAGLKSYLKMEYPNLVTVDFICHGVPSPLVWKKYINYLASGRKITAINFRDKTTGWYEYSLKIEFDNSDVYSQKFGNDLYMKGFLQDLYLRPSCYECKFKGVKRESDITLSDLWGCKDVLPKMFDNQGTSMIFIQSDRGMRIWEAVSTLFIQEGISSYDFNKYNPSMINSVTFSKNRMKFFKDPSIRNIEKYSEDSKEKLTKRTLRKIKRVLYKNEAKTEC